MQKETKRKIGLAITCVASFAIVLAVVAMVALALHSGRQAVLANEARVARVTTEVMSVKAGDILSLIGGKGLKALESVSENKLQVEKLSSGERYTIQDVLDFAKDVARVIKKEPCVSY